MIPLIIVPSLHAQLLSDIGWEKLDRHVCKDSQEAFLQATCFGRASGIIGMFRSVTVSVPTNPQCLAIYLILDFYISLNILTGLHNSLNNLYINALK